MVIWKRPDGGVSITATHPTLTDDEVIALHRDNPAWPKDWEVVGTGENIAVPEDRAFRSAWKCGNNGIGVDLNEARRVVKDQLRAVRAPLLNDLDVKYLRAMESGEDTSAIVAEKQRLRDITKIADSAKDLHALRALYEVKQL